VEFDDDETTMSVRIKDAQDRVLLDVRQVRTRINAPRPSPSKLGARLSGDLDLFQGIGKNTMEIYGGLVSLESWRISRPRPDRSLSFRHPLCPTSGALP
jgi:hypothetical protein